jgi:succinoglycan biosynthesis transport protein ExoP
MKPQQYIAMIRRWWWLVMLGVIVGGGVTYITYRDGGTTYTAETTLLVGGTLYSANPNSGDLQTSSNLAVLYSNLTQYDVVLQGVIDELSLEMSTQKLRKKVTAEIVEGMPWLIISVTDSQYDRSIEIANSVAEQLIANSPTNLTPEQQAQVDLANSQIEILRERLDGIVKEVQAIDQQIEDLSSDDNASTISSISPVAQAQIDDLTYRRNILNLQVTSISTTIAQFSGQTSDVQQRANRLTVIQPAVGVSEETSRSRTATTVVGIAAGTVLSLSVVLLIEYFNTKLRTSAEVVEATGQPVLGTIVRFGRKKQLEPHHLITQHPSGVPIVEAYRTLEANLLFSKDLEKDSKYKNVFLLTSPEQRNGKSTTVANLAATMAVDNFRVLLIDADLRQPKLHTFFKLGNQTGLTDLLDYNIDELLSKVNGSGKSSQLSRIIEEHVQPTAIPNLFVITSGTVPSNPAYFLNLSSLKRWVELCREHFEADVVLIDTPPNLVVADSAILATNLEANVVIVIEAGRTKHDRAIASVNNFTRMGAEVKGIVLNKVNARDADHGHGYDYHYVGRPDATVQMPDLHPENTGIR